MLNEDGVITRFSVWDLYRAAFLDPAGGRSYENRRRSRNAIVVVGQDSYERVFILQAWARHTTIDNVVHKVFETVDRWHPQIFGIDATGPQATFAEAVMDKAADMGRSVPFQRVSSREDKDNVILATLGPLARTGKLFSARNQLELEQEWKTFAPGIRNYKDILDALAHAIRLLPVREREDRRLAEVEQFVQYLRESGAPPSVIASRVAEVYGK